MQESFELIIIEKYQTTKKIISVRNSNVIVYRPLNKYTINY